MRPYFLLTFFLCACGETPDATPGKQSQSVQMVDTADTGTALRPTLVDEYWCQDLFAKGEGGKIYTGIDAFDAAYSKVLVEEEYTDKYAEESGSPPGWNELPLSLAIEGGQVVLSCKWFVPNGGDTTHGDFTVERFRVTRTP